MFVDCKAYNISQNGYCLYNKNQVTLTCWECSLKLESSLDLKTVIEKLIDTSYDASYLHNNNQT